MRNAIYIIIRSLMQIGFYFYFKKITVYGKEKIPKEGGVILSPNHQNGVIDPFIVGGNYGDIITSLTRADVFGGFMHWIFTQMKMIPVYRIRDGYESLKNNDKIFEKCYSILGKGRPLQIFSEAKQHENYYLMPISKGSSRIAIKAQKKYPNQNIYIIPIGINYSNRRNPFGFIHLVYGDPIVIKEHLDDSISEIDQINNLRSELSIKMKKCMWIPENSEHYSKQCSVIKTLSGNESFKNIRKLLKETNTYSQAKPLDRYKKIIGTIGYTLNLPILIFTSWVLSKFKDIVYYSTVKFYIGLIFLPIWWIILFYFSVSMASNYGILIVLTAIITLYIRQNDNNKIFDKNNLY